ncbi:hypothetical protein N1028_02210 [Herbiconiux sp. CPCC 203407]|uniref:Uncharacterized protein n=1 Tax=Herbiconiux oxytropis TaxID=2970915 RepID=A0AA42BVP1_9MICO|nr:hypothetical protein [Herbiconiux oxytropis]MCS5721051.1 hypothetical protein [Herbiconiux oxytropis]MCS5724703.1 hypothetical protein [Herbiconiux oxytropis]
MNSSTASAIAIVIPIVAYLVVIVVSLVIFYWLVKKAIRTALADHYKTVKLYEETGEWTPGPWDLKTPPRGAETGSDD